MFNKFKSRKDLVFVFLISLFSRILTLLVGTMLLVGNKIPVIDDIPNAFIHWDGLWYLDIVNRGYDISYPEFEPSDLECNLGTGLCQRNFAFFPLFPILTKITSQLLFVKPQLGGIILSNLCFIAAACIFYLLVKKLFNKSIALYSWLALLLFPTSYIFSAFMSESLFLLMLLLSIYFGFEKKWITAGIFGALLSATRNTGILVIIPLIIIFLQDELGNKPFKFKHLALIFNKRFILTLILVPLGLVFFMFFLGKTINDPFGFINIQRFWEKPVNDISILLAIPYSFINWELEGSFNIHLYNLFYFLLYVSLFIYGYYKKVIPVSLLSILPWLFIPLLAGTMLALPRYLSVLFPIYILIGILLSKHKVIAVAFYILSGLLSLYPLYSFIQGYWVAV